MFCTRLKSRPREGQRLQSLRNAKEQLYMRLKSHPQVATLVAVEWQRILIYATEVASPKREYYVY
ncbi:MAG: hypothetical protein U9Q90_03660 [Campylobacterota bacterium]|nr:hypothetical protein [Campylobacterota bacterium]